MHRKTAAGAIVAALLASTGLARADGVLNIYNWGNYTSPDVIKKFEKARALGELPSFPKRERDRHEPEPVPS